MKFKKALALLTLLYSLFSIAAKPTDEEVIKKIARPNMQDIELSKSGGTFSTYNLQHWWTRGVTYRINADIKEFPNATIKVGAEARYRIVGENYDFDKLKTAWNEYEGIPLPADNEILTILKKDIIKFVATYNWNQMVSELKGPFLSKDPAVRNVEWHTANSFTIHIQAQYSVVISNTEVQDKKVDYEVRFYRDGVNQPWKNNFVSSTSNEEVVTTKKYSMDEIRAMPTQASMAAEKQAQKANSGLPSVDIPQFSSDKDAIAFIYNQLRTGNKKQVEAMFRTMASQWFFVEGSKVQLNQRGKDALEKLIKNTFDGKVTFAQSYCPQLYIQSYQSNMINIVDALKKNKSRIALEMGGGHYERGKKVGQTYKITALEIWTLRSDDDVAQFKSWPIDELCADTGKTFKQLTVSNNIPKTQTSTGKTPTTVPTASIAAIPKSWSWSMYKSKYLPISLNLIGKAKEEQKMSNGKLVTNITAESKQGSFRVVATDYKQQITQEIANPTHIQFAKNFVKANNALIHKKQVTKLGTGDAQEYLIERGSGADKVMIRFIVFSHGTVVYNVMYTQFKSKNDKQRAIDFIKSIKIG